MADNTQERTFEGPPGAGVDRAVALLHMGQRAPRERAATQRAGMQRAKARKLLAAALRANPRDAAAWYWLGQCVDDEQQRLECARRVRLLQGGDLAVVEPVLLPDKPPEAPSRPRRRWVPASLIGALGALVLIAVVLLNGPRASARSGPDRVQMQGKLQASGIVRAEEVVVASEYGGPVVLVDVQEGQAVSEGELLVRLDTALLDAQIEVTEAAVELARARLLQVKAGARPGQAAVAQAQLAQAEAVRMAAAQVVSDTEVLVAHPRDVQMRIAVTQEQIEAQQLEIERALAIKDAAEVARDAFRDAQEAIMDAGGPGTRRVQVPGAPPGTYYEYTVPSLPLQMHLAPNQWWQAWVGVNAAAAEKEGLEASLASLYSQQADPQRLEAELDQARARLAQADAQILAAQAQVEWLQAGATPEQVATLEARVAQNRAALRSLRSKRAMMEVTAPIDGLVISLTAHEGEVAAPGSALLSVADLSEVKLKVYLPETQIGRIRLGQRAQVTADSFPGRLFEGRVAHIADSAEFTPRNVATQEERINLVFAVEIALPNEDGALKPGMPADAMFNDG